MLAVSLIFVGITLTLNGIVNLAKKEKKILVILNLFTASIIFIFNIYQIISVSTGPLLVGYLGGLLFGLTNLIIAFDDIWGNSKFTTGVFSGFATASSIFISIYYLIGGDIFRTATWGIWSLIWLFAFIAFVITPKFQKSCYVMFVIQGVITTFSFGFFQLFQIITF